MSGSNGRRDLAASREANADEGYALPPFILNNGKLEPHGVPVFYAVEYGKILIFEMPKVAS